MADPHTGWQHVARFCGLLTFLAFVLWVFATKFDASELKVIAGFAGPVAAVEFWPMVRKVIAETLSRGGRPE